MSETQELIEYLKQIMPSAQVECAECGAETEAAKAITRADSLYCSDECAARSNAILLKAQPKSVKAGCFDI